MTMSECCRRVIGVWRGVQSPFVRLVAIDYYDGPTDGLVECGACGTMYAFHKIDWDYGQNLRIFALAPTHGSFADLERGVSTNIKWPRWILTGDEQQSLGEIFQHPIDAASPVEFVIATQDLLGVIDVWRPAGLPQEVDWFAELGCDRDADEA